MRKIMYPLQTTALPATSVLVYVVSQLNGSLNILSDSCQTSMDHKLSTFISATGEAEVC